MVRATGDHDAPRGRLVGERMRGSTEEEESQRGDAVRDVEPLIALPVEQREVPRILSVARAAGERGDLTGEEETEHADRVGDVERAVLVAIADHLRAALDDARRLDPVDRSFRTERTGRSRGEDVELAGLVLADPKHELPERQITVHERELANREEVLAAILLGIEIEDPSRSVRGRRELAEDVLPHELGKLRSAIDESADHGRAFRMVVLRDRVDHSFRWAIRGRVLRIERIEAMRAFADHPAVVSAALDDIDLLEKKLPDVREPQLSRLSI